MKHYIRILLVLLSFSLALGAISCGKDVVTCYTDSANATEMEVAETDGEMKETDGEMKETDGEMKETDILTSLETDPESEKEEPSGTATRDIETVANTESESESNAETELKSETDLKGENETRAETESKIETAVETETKPETSGVEISENEGYASAVAENGFRYTAKNYSAIENGYFTANQGLEITFPDEIAGEFNRFSLKYESTAPMQIFVTYLLDGEEKTDYFYIEAIKTEFRGLIDCYLDGKNSSGIKKIVFNTCEENDAKFILHSLSTEKIDFYEDDVFVENERFKVGVRLSWGGAMTYFEDKADGIDGLGNLVNIHDTGRLIQQSFYGTYTNEEYVSGNYGDTKWPYNPVQGGNKFQHGRTRLIDIEVGEDYIYIKAQSLDWALDAVLTHTYYENTYTLSEENVHVDNRMVDFSGWKHIQGTQEIPAMYIVSYFGTLAFYNGIKPWTDDIDGVSYERELGGWGASVTVPMIEGNTETWAIWMNEADGFCFGIYTPNIDRLVAIRHQYDGSKDPMSNSTSYVATSSVIEVVPYFPVEYQYLLATGSFEDVRAEFKENKDFAANESLNYNKAPFRVSAERFDMTDLDFSIEGIEKVFSGHRILTTNYDADEKAIRFCLTDKSDPYAFLDFYWNSDRELVAEDYNVFEIEYMMPETNSKKGYYLTLFLCAGEILKATDGYHVSASLVADGKYHTTFVRLPKDKWSGDIHKIRVDIVDSGEVGDEIFVKRIRLLKYPEMAVENDLTVQNAEKLIGAPARTQVDFSEEEKAVKLTVLDKNDVHVQLDFSSVGITAEEYTTLEITYMMPTTNSKESYSYQAFFDCGESSGFTEVKSVTGTYSADGEYHTVSIKFDSKADWSGLIKKIRFDYFSGCADGDVIYIKSINFK